MSYSPPPPPPPPGGGGYGYAAPRNNQKAIWSLVLGIAGLLCCGVLGIPALILGSSAKKEIAASGGTQTGAGMAQAGFILGIIALVFTVILIVLTAAGVVQMPSSTTSP